MNCCEARERRSKSAQHARLAATDRRDARRPGEAAPAPGTGHVPAARIPPPWSARGPSRRRASHAWRARQRALLALLCLRRRTVVAVDRIVDELWGDSSPATARQMVEVYVRTRECPPKPLLEAEARSNCRYSDQLRHVCRRGGCAGRHPGRGRCVRSCRAGLGRLRRLYRGPPRDRSSGRHAEARPRAELTGSCLRATIVLVGASATFSFDGRRILTSSLDATVPVFACDIRRSFEDLVARSEARLAGVARALMPAEWCRYLEPGG
jgi:hypothetical protein